MSNETEVDEAVVQAYYNGLRDASQEWANERAELEARLEGISRECNYLRGQEHYWQSQAKQYENWFEEALNKYHAAKDELRQYTEPDMVIVQLRSELARALDWIGRYQVENRKLRGEPCHTKL
jgi:hypothetical protein